MKQLLLNLAVVPPPSLDNFIVGQNQQIIDLLREVVQGRSAYRSIYLWGSACGKTHLLQACEAASRQNAVPLVTVDQVQDLSDEAQIALFDLYNSTCQASLLVSSTLPPAQAGLRPDLATRLSAGLVYALQPLSHKDKVAALKSHVTARGLIMPDSVLNYCLTHLRRDLRVLMQVLDALDEWSLVVQKPVTVSMLKTLLREGSLGAG